MEVLFIIDSLQDLERKIALMDDLGADVKFFINAKYVAKVMNNKYIVERVKAIYNNNVNVTIDKYLRSANYNPVPTLLYYSSANLNHQMLDKIRENLKFNPTVVYIKKKFNWWDKFKNWFYQKLIKAIFGLNDEMASIKLQYFNAELMALFAKTNFKNHVFSIPNSLSIELDKNEEKTYYSKPKFNKNYLYNPIVMCLILICYVVLEKFFSLPFAVYFLVAGLLITVIVNWVVMIIKNNFDIRYKK